MRPIPLLTSPLKGEESREARDDFPPLQASGSESLWLGEGRERVGGGVAITIGKAASH